MATATSLTKERMLEIEAASIVDGEVVGDDLHLITFGGDTINAGDVRGPGGGGIVVEQSFASASTDWLIAHNQGTKGVSVYTENGSGVPIRGDITYPDLDHVNIHFYYAQTGLARVFN